MSANYDTIASNYDWLSRLIFGKALINAQLHLLAYIQDDSHVLIVGGGTGWILEELVFLEKKGLNIDYVESSAEMMILSKKRKCGPNQVQFIQMPIESYVSNSSYDVIITPFLFDNFTMEKIGHVFFLLNDMLVNKGLWLYADFVYMSSASPFWQKILLKSMYLFFRITAKIETNKLVDMSPFFKCGFGIMSEKSFYAKFVKSIVFQKY